MKKDKYIYIEPYKMLFIHEDGGYYPLYYDCVKTENGYEGKTIKTNTILGNWLMYVKHSFKTPSKNSNKVMQGNLYLYQWYLSIQVIISVMEFKGDMWNIMACRQVGKTWLMSHIVAFLTCFGNIYVDAPKWTSIIGSYSELSVRKLYTQVRLNIYKCIEFFNKLYPTRKLIYGKDGKEINLSDTESKMEIGMELENGTQVIYSDIYAFSTDTKKDGFSSFINWVDESSFTSYENYFTSFHSFLSAYSGTLLTTSINTVDSLSLTYLLQHDEKTKLFKYDYKEHVKMIKYTDEVKSEKYLNEAENYKRMMGENSTAFKVNYSLDSDGMLEGKFCNMDVLKNNNLLIGNLEDMLPIRKDKFVTLGIDIGLGGSGDRTIGTIIESTMLENGIFTHTVKNIIPYTYEKDEHLTEKLFYEKTKSLAYSNKVDFITCDSTGMQKYIVSGLNDYLKQENIKSQVIATDFSNDKKTIMYQYLESCMYSQRIAFPKENLAQVDRGWNLLLKEMLGLLKFKKTGSKNYKYEAPKGEHDDCVASLAISVFCPTFVLQSQMEGKEFRLGDLTFTPRLQKASWIEEKKETFKVAKNWLSLK